MLTLFVHNHLTDFTFRAAVPQDKANRIITLLSNLADSDREYHYTVTVS